MIANVYLIVLLGCVFTQAAPRFVGHGRADRTRVVQSWDRYRGLSALDMMVKGRIDTAAGVIEEAKKFQKYRRAPGERSQPKSSLNRKSSSSVFYEMDPLINERQL